MKQKTKNLLHLFLTLCVVGVFLYLDYDAEIIRQNHWTQEYARIAAAFFWMILCLIYGACIGLIFTAKEAILRNLILFPVLLSTFVLSAAVISRADFAVIIRADVNDKIGFLVAIALLTLLSFVGCYIMALLKWLILKIVAFIANQKKQA